MNNMESSTPRNAIHFNIDKALSTIEETEIAEEEEANDTTFTLSIAQKCAARAALHLGIETVTTDVLYVLADALLLYMERVGSFISHFVERDGYSDNRNRTGSSSRYRSTSTMIDDDSDFAGANISKRWSGHINLFDLLHGIESCASQAENQLVIDSSSSNNNDFGASMTQKCAAGSSHWEGLAEFLFGKDWFSIDVTKVKGSVITGNGNENSGTNVKSGDAKQATIVGAKGSNTVGKKLINAQHHDGNDDPNNKVQINGWNAPFPEEVPHYPIRKQIKSLDSFVTANHACHDSRMPVKERFNQDKKSNNIGYNQEVEQSIALIPDHVFLDGITSFWGMNESKQSNSSVTESINDKSNTMDIDQDSSQASTTGLNKRKQTDDNDNQKRSKIARSELDDENKHVHTTENILPLYVPKFLPPFPPTHTYRPPASVSKISSSSRLLNNLNGNRSIKSSKTNISSNSQGMVNSKTLPSQFDQSQQGSIIRSALVSLRQNVRNSDWGEINDESDNSLSISSLQVKTSKIRRFDEANAAIADSSPTASSAVGVSGQGPSVPAVPIKPMTKASSARASRILEGSME